MSKGEAHCGACLEIMNLTGAPPLQVYPTVVTHSPGNLRGGHEDSLLTTAIVSSCPTRKGYYLPNIIISGLYAPPPLLSSQSGHLQQYIFAGLSPGGKS